MNALKFTGAVGEVRWSYRKVAELRSWSLNAEGEGGTLTAKVVTCDAFGAAQQPLTFAVPRPKGQAWTWPIKSLQMTADTLTATLGPQS